MSGLASSPPQGNAGAYESTEGYESTGVRERGGRAPRRTGTPPRPTGALRRMRAPRRPCQVPLQFRASVPLCLGLESRGPAQRCAVQRARRSTAAATAQPARRRAAGSQARGAARVPGVVAPAAIRYETPLPSTVATAFFAKAKGPLARAEQLHRDVAGRAGIRWQLLAACDWMQCHADHTLLPC